MLRLTYSVSEVAKMTGVGDSTVRGWIDDGTLAALRIGARVLIHRDELVRLGVLRETKISERAQRIVADVLSGRA